MVQTALKPRVDVEEMGTGVREKATEKLAEYLSNALADTYVLYNNTQGVHWNVVGPTFYSVHKLTEEHYEDMAEAIDNIAERIRALGHPAPSTFGDFEERAVLKNRPATAAAAKLVDALVEDHKAIADRMRRAVAAAEEVQDVYTADLLIARIGAHEEAAWMLRALAAE